MERRKQNKPDKTQDDFAYFYLPCNVRFHIIYIFTTKKVYHFELIFVILIVWYVAIGYNIPKCFTYLPFKKVCVIIKLAFELTWRKSNSVQMHFHARYFQHVLTWYLCAIHRAIKYIIWKIDNSNDIIIWSGK